MTHNEEMLQEALRLNQDGFKLLFTKDPSSPNGKAPIGKWHRFQTEDQTGEDIKTLWKYANKQDANLGLGCICDDTLEVIDIDTKYFLEHHSIYDVFDACIDVLGEDVYKSLVECHTISGGYHLVYRSQASTGNQKLASRKTLEHERKDEKDNIRVLIETRAKGGMFIISPSKGYTFDSKPLSSQSVPILSTDQRNALIFALSSFDEIQKVSPKSTVKKKTVKKEVLIQSKSTIEAFNDAHTPVDFLVDAGWQYKYTCNRTQNMMYVRAGKTLREGVGGGYHEPTNLFRVFTSSTGFEPETTYNAFQVYSILEHNGDDSAAAKELYKNGYGDRMSKKTVTASDNIAILSQGSEADKEVLQDTAVMDEIFSKNFDIRVKPKVKPSTLFMKTMNQIGELVEVGIGGDGNIVTFCGLQKTRKSAIASCAVSCFLEGGSGETMNFRAVQDGRNVLHLDTEQGEYDYYNTCKEMYWQQGIIDMGNPPNFYSYRLTDYTLKQKVQFLEYSLKKIGNIGTVYLDGIVDLCSDYNDQKESRALVEYIARLASKWGFLFIDILHNARSTGLARGHLGTELMNKGKCNINIKKDKDLGHSTLTVEDIRGAFAPDPFDFTHDVNGHLQLD